MVTLLEAAHHLRGILPINRWTPLLGLLGMVLSLFVWRRLAARLHWRPLPTLLTVLSLLAVLTLTLAPKGWWGNHRSLAQCVPSNWADIGAAASHVGGGLESWLNIAMLMPLGFALVMASRRVVWPAAFVVLLPVAIELTQVVVPGRECSVSDWIANASGGLVGVAVGAVWNRRLRARRRARLAARPPGSPPPAQRDVLTKS